MRDEPTSFKEWCRIQREEATATIDTELPQEDVAAEEEHSLHRMLPYVVLPPQLDFWGVSSTDVTFGKAETYLDRIDRCTTTLMLGSSNDSLHTQPLDLQLGALAHSFAQLFPERAAPALYTEGHGREPGNNSGIDLSETVGWFTTLYPLQVAVQNSVLDTIRQVKDARSRIVQNGRPYFASHYQTGTNSQTSSCDEDAEILFNYVGQYQELEASSALLKLDEELASALVEVSPEARRMALIEFNTTVQAGQLVVAMRVHRGMRHQGRLRQLLPTFLDNLTRAVQALADAPRSYTLADFPLLSISDAGLRALVGNRLSAIAPGGIEDIYPCTPVQEGILLGSQKRVASYQNMWIWECIPQATLGHLSPVQLEAAWREAVARHSIFCTVFVEHPDTGRLLQVLLRDASPKVSCISSGSVSPVDALNSLESPHFSQEQPPHMFTISQADDGRVACRLDISHALIDATSITILLDDLSSLYRHHILPPASQFRDIVYQLGQRSNSARLDHWRRFLHNVRPCELSFIQPQRPSVDTAESEFRYLTLPKGRARRIYDFCRKHHITRSVFIQIAWGLVLAYFTGSSDVCFGYLASGRDVSVNDVEAVIGPLVNMLISRLDLSYSAREVMMKTNQQSAENLKFQHVSLAEIQHGIKLQGHQLFNTVVTVREMDSMGHDAPDAIRFVEAKGRDPHEVLVLPRFPKDKTLTRL